MICVVGKKIEIFENWLLVGCLLIDMVLCGSFLINKIKNILIFILQI